VIVVDSDEFIFCNRLNFPVRDHLSAVPRNLYFCIFWQIYKHCSEDSPDPTVPLHLQRKHGDPAILNCYIKPTIARPGLDLSWGYGNHAIMYGDSCFAWDTPNALEMEQAAVSVYPFEMLQGAHWKLFDLDEVTRRRVHFRSRRQSTFNIKALLTYHHHNVKQSDVLDEYNSMKDSPVVIKDRVIRPQLASSARSILENILSELALTDNLPENFISQKVVDEKMSDNDYQIWYKMVKPQKGMDGAAEEMFHLACSYWKQGYTDKALTIVRKSMLLSPENFCYAYYLDHWLESLRKNSMKPIFEAETIQIDITNHCFMSCLYCSRYNRHLRADQRTDMTLEQIRTALDTLRIWPGRVGIIGGEPLLHPDFEEICSLLRSRFHRDRLGLWTSGGKNLQRYLDMIHQTFGFIAYNEHNKEQLETCKHQPLTVSISEVVPDEAVRRDLIDDCWVQRTWCPTINHFGAYFCEVAAAQDVLLNDGRNAWPVEHGWWKKTPEQFQDQVMALCHNCGMAIPMERELIKKKTEKFTPGLLKRFREKGLSKVSDSDVELFQKWFSKEELAENSRTWTPGNYRGDRFDDDSAPEGLGISRKL
jgi:hypothetical protein